MDERIQKYEDKMKKTLSGQSLQRSVQDALIRISLIN